MSQQELKDGCVLIEYGKVKGRAFRSYSVDVNALLTQQKIKDLCGAVLHCELERSVLIYGQNGGVAALDQ